MTRRVPDVNNPPMPSGRQDYLPPTLQVLTSSQRDELRAQGNIVEAVVVPVPPAPVDVPYFRPRAPIPSNTVGPGLGLYRVRLLRQPSAVFRHGSAGDP